MLRRAGLLGLLLCASAAAFSASRISMERDIVGAAKASTSWVQAGRTPSQTKLKFTLALNIKPESSATLERVFHEVSDPRHPHYGKHWSQSDMLQLLAPEDRHVDAVRNFFGQFGAKSLDFVGELVTIELTASQAEAAFDCEFFAFKHKTRTDVTVHRAPKGYTLPADVAEAVSTVDGILRLPRLSAASTVTTSSSQPFPTGTCDQKCNGFVTPKILSDRYKLGDPPASVASNSSMAVAEFQGQGWDQADCDQLAQACHTPNITVDVQIGGNAQPGIEALLDIQYIKALGGAIPLTDFYQAEYSLLNWAESLMKMSNPPLVNSVSYGNDEKQQSGAAYMFSCNTQFKALAVRGLSILFASGDQGVCGREGCLFGIEPFHPDFPAASPYITAVGGTDFVTQSVIGDEKAWTDGGGGYSNTFGIPDWQKDAVAAYQKDCPNCPPAKYWNATGRGYPDVAALGGQVNPYCIHAQNRFAGVAGTSASTPVTAAVFAKLNDIRLKAGKPPLGFLNPFIYQNPSAFNDVTSGCNTGGSPHGFTASKGWDPATGWGTPNFEALSKLV